MKMIRMDEVAAHMNLMQEVEEALRKVSKLKMYQMDHTTHKLAQFRRDWKEAIEAADRLLGVIKS